MYDHKLQRGRKHFCRYCFQVFTEEILKRDITDYPKIIDQERIKMYEKGEHVGCKSEERKLKSPFRIYAHFESILIPEDDGK